MQRLLASQVAIFVAATLSVFSSLTPANAAVFDQREIDQSKFIAIAAPVGKTSHQLLIVEQVANSRSCWREIGAQPTVVDPLLVSFDFTGICSRSTDSNGYSIRMAGQDLGLKYSLRLLKRNNDLVLVGVSNSDYKAPAIEIGRTYGATSGFTKIVLSPGWRMTKRVYNGRPLGHIYLTSDVALANLIATNGQSTSIPPVTSTPPITQPPVLVPPPVSVPPTVPVLPKPPSVKNPVSVSTPPTIPVPGLPKPPIVTNLPPSTSTPPKPAIGRTPSASVIIPVPPPESGANPTSINNTSDRATTPNLPAAPGANVPKSTIRSIVVPTVEVYR